MRIQAPSSPQLSGCQELATVRNTRSGCGIMMVARPSALVTAVIPSGEPLGLAGYCAVTVVPHPHNPAVLVAGNDALFVAPAYRNGLTAVRLMQESEAEAKRRGASRFTWHCRAGTPLIATLERRGYKLADQLVMKEI